MNAKEQQMNGRELAAATGLGLWVIRGIKKANRIFAAQAAEPLIFTGRYSTPSQISRWLAVHPEFVASRVLATTPAAQAQPARRSRPAA